jgi:hypothetical protein
MSRLLLILGVNTSTMRDQDQRKGKLPHKRICSGPLVIVLLSAPFRFGTAAGRSCYHTVRFGPAARPSPDLATEGRGVASRGPRVGLSSVAHTAGVPELMSSEHRRPRARTELSRRSWTRAWFTWLKFLVFSQLSPSHHITLNTPKDICSNY